MILGCQTPPPALSGGQTPVLYSLPETLKLIIAKPRLYFHCGTAWICRIYKSPPEIHPDTTVGTGVKYVPALHTAYAFNKYVMTGEDAEDPLSCRILQAAYDDNFEDLMLTQLVVISHKELTRMEKEECEFYEVRKRTREQVK